MKFRGRRNAAFPAFKLSEEKKNEVSGEGCSVLQLLTTLGLSGYLLHLVASLAQYRK